MSWQSTISVGGALYSVPLELIDERVWARIAGDELIVMHADGPAGPREVARHQLTTPGEPSIQDSHYPPRPAGGREGGIATRRPRHKRPTSPSQESTRFVGTGDRESDPS